VFLEPSVNLAPRRRRATRVQFVDPLEEDDEGEGGEGGVGGEGDRALSPAPLHSAGGAAFQHHLSSPPYGRFLASVADPGCLSQDPNYFPSRIRFFPSRIPDPQQRISSILTQKMVSKLSEI
jgi:hypothetical protein